MERIYREELRLRTEQVDLCGTWRPSAILDLMQEAAGTHGEMLGFGRAALLDQNMFWVLARLEVEMDRYPQFNDVVTVETFPTAVRRWFFPRYYRFFDVRGEELGRAASLWLLLDTASRKMVRPDPILHLLPDNSDLPAPLGLPATVAEVGGTLTTGTYVPQYRDLDMNRHVNNIRYMDLCCDALGIDTMSAQTFRRFAVNYTREIRPGQTIRTELRRLGNDLSFSGLEGDERHFDIGGTLMDR